MQNMEMKAASRKMKIPHLSAETEPKQRNYMLTILCHTIETKKKKMKKYCIRGNNWDRSQRGTYEYMEVKIRRDLVDKKRGGRSYSR